MDVWELAGFQTTLDAYLFIIEATFKENSLNFLLVEGALQGFSDFPESPAQAIL